MSNKLKCNRSVLFLIITGVERLLEEVGELGEVAVVGAWGDSEQVAQQRVDADVAELAGLGVAVLEVGSYGAETYLHVARGVIEAVVACSGLYGSVGEQPAYIGQNHHVANIGIGAIV